MNVALVVLNLKIFEQVPSSHLLQLLEERVIVLAFLSLHHFDKLVLDSFDGLASV